jgi:RNA polymerase sigma-70 factor (sigma-E family)
MFPDRRRDAAFTEFAAAAQQRLFRQAYLLAGDREAALDLVQTTLTALYVAWPRVTNPPAYAHRTLVRAFLATRRRAVQERERLERLPERPAADPDPEGAMTVLAALGRLPDRMRSVVVLRYWEDLSVEDTAAALGCSTGTVKSSSSRGLAHLRELLGEAFEERVPSATTTTKESDR